MEDINHFVKNATGLSVKSILKLPQSGSSRENFIVKTDGETLVVTQNENIEENACFLYFSKVFESLNLNTPKILGIDNNQKRYIQTFLGEKTLSELIAIHGENEYIQQLITQTLDSLFSLQQKTMGKIDYTKTFEYKEYNRIPILHDCHYFKFLLVDVLEIPYKKYDLLIEFETLASHLENCTPKGIMIRDFQARNIIVNNENKVSFIDYQSAMYGPLLYDVASFLYQAKANFSEKFILQNLSYFIEKFPEKEQKNLWKSLPYIRLIRALQVLGAYGFRGVIQQKKHFLESLPMGIKNLSDSYTHLPEKENFPTLKKVIDSLKIKYNI